MKSALLIAEIIFLGLLVSACSSSSDQKDLQNFMEETKRRPHGRIEPLPPFTLYQPFAYGAMTLRSPFDKPIIIDATVKGGKSVEPDPNREPEELENYNVANLKMVGSVVKAGRIWVLIDSGQKVVPVTIGNYMGKNNGKIVTATDTQLELLEIVADGSSGWVERPRIIKLQEKE
ncbi:MAG TPA: pilus assembly protein PilP [Cellvibrio sp.]|nr:pilus assembly protein PilP [Cellvibrio sp.]